MKKKTGLFAYVTDAQDNDNLMGPGAVIKIDLAAGKPVSAITILDRSKSGGAGTNAIIVTKDGKTAYVTNEFTNSPAGSVSRIDLGTGKIIWSVTVGAEPVDIKFVPKSGEKWAWVANYKDQTISTLDLVNGEIGGVIQVPGLGPNTVAFTPDGKICYVANWQTDNPAGSSVTPIKVTKNGASGTVQPSIAVGLNPNWIAITHDGKTAYVANKGSRSMTPIDVASGIAGAPISLPGQPIQMEISPDGKLAYVAVAGTTEAGAGIDAVVPFDLTVTPGKAGAVINLASGAQPHWVAFSPDGKTAYIVGNGNSTVTPIKVAGNVLGTPITVSTDPVSDILDIAIVQTK